MDNASNLTWVVGAILTAAQLNTHIRDNERYLYGLDGEIILGDYPDYPSTAQGDIFYHNGTKLARLAAGTSGYTLKTNGAAANPSWTETGTIALGLIADDTLRNSNDTEKTTDQSVYTKRKEVLLNASLAVCRIKFDLKISAAGNVAYGQIYKNGSAIGTERTNGTEAYATFSEDFANLTTNDLIQIYIKTSGGVLTAYVRNMRFHYSRQVTMLGGDTLTTALATTGDPTISMTNQDPA